MNPSMAPKRQTNGDVKRDLSKLASVFRQHDFETRITGDTLVLTSINTFDRTEGMGAKTTVEKDVDSIIRSSGVKAFRQHSIVVNSTTQNTINQEDTVRIQVYVQIKPVNGFDS